MNIQTSLLAQLAVSQAFILFAAFILAYYPSLYVPAIIAFMVVMGVILYRGQSGGVSREKVNEVLSSRILYSEGQLEKIMAEDRGLVEEYSRLMKATTIPLLVTFPLAIGLFFILPGAYSGLVEAFGLRGPLARMIEWLLVFETISGVTFGLRALMARRHQVTHMLMIAREFEVREKGLVVHAGLRPMVIPFPLGNGYRVVVDEDRRFVELVEDRRRVRIRLYTSRPRRVYELIRRLGAAKTS